MRTRALDRVLLWHHLVVPNWHIGYFRVVYWDKFGRPDNPPYDLPIRETWWVAPDKRDVVASAQAETAAGEGERGGGTAWVTGAGLVVLVIVAALFVRRARSGRTA